MKDFLKEKRPIRDPNVVFPKDEQNRQFSSTHYIRKLRNGESYDRK